MAQIMYGEPERVPVLLMPLTVVFAIVALPFTLVIALPKLKNWYLLTKRIVLYATPYLEYPEVDKEKHE